MVMQMYYLEFLREVHAIVKPRGYLEIGVRSGDSLALASCPSIGIDPNPLVPPRPGIDFLFSVTSDEFFGAEQVDLDMDLAFIDGMHLIEYVLRDFNNVSKYANERTIIAIDDVLPYNQGTAARNQPPGDWTGDVWKITGILELFRDDLDIVLVDTRPTGTLLVTGFPGDEETRERFATHLDTIAEAAMISRETVPQYVLNRSDAVPSDEALEWLRSLY